jgi:hypothetical protein
MRYNMGCGFNKAEGYINVDANPLCEPDVVCDLELQDWHFVDPNTAQEVVFNHSLEHMGETAALYRDLIQKLHEACAPNATILINVPHPRHDNFIDDPTHVRAITPAALSLLSKKNCAYFRENRAANSCLADQWGVDFEMISVERILDPRFAGYQGQDKVLEKMELLNNNLITEYRIVLRAVK